jgi:polysaccharide biosynthesis/export protein
MGRSDVDLRTTARLHFAWSAVGLLVCGCASSPSVTVRELPSAIMSRGHETLAATTADDEGGADDGGPYRVGPGDTVLVAVYGHPELSIAPYSGGSVSAQSGRLGGLVVDNDGSIQFPLIGSVQVAGKSGDELRRFLQQELATYVKDPKVTVQVVFTGSIRYYLLGQFTNPGLKYSDRPTRLLETMSLGGSINLERASLRTAYVARGNKRLAVDFRRLILDGDLTQNIRLHSGDVILVPDKATEQAFVFGGTLADNARGGAVPFVNGRLSLVQALAQVGFGYQDRVQGRLSKTHVIRSEGDQGELFIVDAARILEGQAGSFELAPGDVVFVPPTAVTTWNEVLAQLLPSLQTISGLLTPFVQIKYLSQ